MAERDDDLAPLSEAGQARRAAMLGALLDEVPRASQRRRRRRAAASAFGLIVGASLIGYAWQATRWTRPPTPIAQTTSDAPGCILLENPSLIVVERVTTDEDAVARLAVAPDGASIERISDDDLLRTLSAIGRPVGLIRDGAHVALTADVTTKPKGPGASAI